MTAVCGVWAEAVNAVYALTSARVFYDSAAIWSNTNELKVSAEAPREVGAATTTATAAISFNFMMYCLDS